MGWKNGVFVIDNVFDEVYLGVVDAIDLDREIKGSAAMNSICLLAVCNIVKEVKRNFSEVVQVL